MKRIVLHREARKELEKAILHYELAQKGLGIDLQQEVEKTTLTIQENPQRGVPYRSGKYRYFLVDRFPYVIYYTERPEHITVVAIAHGRRRPGYWRRRKVE